MDFLKGSATTLGSLALIFGIITLISKKVVGGIKVGDGRSEEDVKLQYKSWGLRMMSLYIVIPLLFFIIAMFIPIGAVKNGMQVASIIALLLYTVLMKFMMGMPELRDFKIYPVQGLAVTTILTIILFILRLTGTFDKLIQ